MNFLAEILDVFDPISHPLNSSLAHSASATNDANQEKAQLSLFPALVSIPTVSGREEVREVDQQRF